MKPHQLRMKLKSAFRLAGVALIVIAPMSIRTAPSNEAQAYSSGPTGWCTDHSGRNFRCGSGGGSSSSGGGGCAQSGHHQRASAAERRSQSSAMNNEGVELYEQRKYATAAGSFEFALSRNPANTVARNNLGDALNMLGVNASKRRDYASALVYYERALKAREKKLYRDNLAKAQRSLPNGGRKTCGLCSKALISDVGYGLDRSAEFGNYANQAVKNFHNCSDRLPNQCKGSKGAELADQVNNCTRYMRADMNPFKSCVRQSLSQIR